ncbi:MAG: alanine racemase [Ruminococcaceae bacterium]|nr:alanine racemase [Oscillospiraceae bacterium]
MEYRRIYAKIDLDALEHNFELIQSRLPAGTDIMAVIKADAYGHGAVEVARILEGQCHSFGIATIEEAVELRNAGITSPLLILGFTAPEQYAIALEYDVELTVFSYDAALLLNKVCAKSGKRAIVHIAVDTGMGRIGFQVSEVDADAAAKIFSLENIRVKGLFSHYATADELDKTYALAQKERFDRFESMLSERGCHAEIKHLNNSAGIMELCQSNYDLARAGIILYGLYPSDEVIAEDFPLRPVMELITHISHVKTLSAGYGVSYGRIYVTDKETTIATIPVGYADGYPRCLSGKGYVLIGGVKCPIVGRICMDQMMVDISAVPDAKVGDTVVLFGTYGNNRISVEEISELASSFNYEFVSCIARRVPRAYFKNGEYLRTVSYLEY